MGGGLVSCLLLLYSDRFSTVRICGFQSWDTLGFRVPSLVLHLKYKVELLVTLQEVSLISAVAGIIIGHSLGYSLGENTYLCASIFCKS